jgi:hypothetical protein
MELATSPVKLCTTVVLALCTKGTTRWEEGVAVPAWEWKEGRGVERWREDRVEAAGTGVGGWGGVGETDGGNRGSGTR